MTSESTSLARANSVSGEWRRYFAFVKHPHLPERADGFTRAGAVATLRMLGLDVLVMLALVVVAGTAQALGVKFPDNELNSLEWTPKIIALVVIVAPLAEELTFRSWLSGRPGHTLAALLVAVGMAMLLFLGNRAGLAESSMVPVAAFGVCVALALTALFLLRRRGAMRWFARLFPGFYWLSTIGFATMHMLNYTDGALLVLLPLVLPQLITGSILGYIRVNYGLWTSVLLHALHNGAAVGAVVLGMKLGLT